MENEKYMQKFRQVPFFFILSTLHSTWAFTRLQRKLPSTLAMSRRFLVSTTVFMLLFCACIHWNHGAFIGSNSYDKSGYSKVANNLEREYRNTPDFKIQRSYEPDNEDKRSEDLKIERTTLRVHGVLSTRT